MYSHRLRSRPITSRSTVPHIHSSSRHISYALLFVAFTDVSKAMSQSRHRPVSQTADKASGICSSCYAIRQLHLKVGKIHRHCPRNSSCPGSDLSLFGALIAAPHHRGTRSIRRSSSARPLVSNSNTTSQVRNVHAYVLLSYQLWRMCSIRLSKGHLIGKRGKTCYLLGPTFFVFPSVAVSEET